MHPSFVRGSFAFGNKRSRSAKCTKRHLISQEASVRSVVRKKVVKGQRKNGAPGGRFRFHCRYCASPCEPSMRGPLRDAAECEMWNPNGFVQCGAFEDPHTMTNIFLCSPHQSPMPRKKKGKRETICILKRKDYFRVPQDTPPHSGQPHRHFSDSTRPGRASARGSPQHIATVVYNRQMYAEKGCCMFSPAGSTMLSTCFCLLQKLPAAGSSPSLPCGSVDFSSSIALSAGTKRLQCVLAYPFIHPAHACRAQENCEIRRPRRTHGRTWAAGRVILRQRGAQRKIVRKILL